MSAPCYTGPAPPGPTPYPATTAQRAALIAAYAEANPAKSLRQLAAECKLSKSQVHRILHEANPAKVYPRGRHPKLGKQGMQMVAYSIKLRIRPERMAETLGVSVRTVYRAIARIKAAS